MKETVIVNNFHPNEYVAKHMGGLVYAQIQLLGGQPLLIPLDDHDWYIKYAKNPDSREQLLQESIQKLATSWIYVFHDSSDQDINKYHILRHLNYFVVEVPAKKVPQKDPKIVAFGKDHDPRRSKKYFETESDLPASIQAGLCSQQIVEFLAKDINDHWHL